MPELRAAIRRFVRGATTDEDPAGAARPKARYVPDAIDGVARVRAAGHDQPIVLAIWPYDPENPFQDLLASRFEALGIIPIPLGRLSDLDDPTALPAMADLRSDGVLVVLHLHWLARVLRGVESDAEGRERVAAFLATLDAFRAAGGRIVWTVHNVLPHDTAYPAVDLELRRGVVARADVVHVLSEGTVAAVAAAPSAFEIPASKVLHVPHPAYLGVYPDAVSATDARQRYALGPTDLVFGFVGNLRPYKGLDELLDTFESLIAAPSDDRRRRLLIAGMPAKDGSMDALIERARAHPDIVVDARRVPADELSLPIRASDVIVLPYHDSLNSGALLLALSFGTPVIAAASPHVTETVGPDAAITFDPEDRGALGAALRDVDRLLTPRARDAALETARRFDPAELSEQFAVALCQRLGVDPRG